MVAVGASFGHKSPEPSAGCIMNLDYDALIDGLIWFACLIPIIALHEFGHAWMASKRGDDTARALGRVTINPMAHIDPIGTVAIPGIIVLLGAMGNEALSGFLIGWGRPVPVNPGKFKHRALDDVLVALAGPVMNIVLALFAVVVMRGALEVSLPAVYGGFRTLAILSLFLCFFNLLPIPPLDGSHVLKHLIGMSEMTYHRIAQYGIFILIVAINTPVVGGFLFGSTIGVFRAMAWIVGVE